MIIPEELEKHYSSYKVNGIQEYIKKSSVDEGIIKDDERLGKRYIRLNPRFNEEETLIALKVSKMVA